MDITKVEIRLHPQTALTDVMDWCQQRQLKFYTDWSWRYGQNGRFEFRFRDPKMATLFALKWL